MRFPLFVLTLLLGGWLGERSSLAEVGDPQLKTDHPWYPGELALSNFERLFATQAKLYERVTGKPPVTEEQKALAAWLWRNTHFAHGEEGRENLFGGKFDSPDNVTRDYWLGLYSHGFALCGTTHGQWCAEMNALLGHGRARAVGVAGHNSFEVFLTGGAYGEGKWVLLDHDISTVVFNEQGTQLLSIPEIQANLSRYTNPAYKPARQQGWLVSGLHPADAQGVYGAFNTAEYLAGYAGPPPQVHLRRGEKLRRYFTPGLEDGKTFVFWGRNYNTAGIPGPERSRTWVNQPEKMHGAQQGTPHRDGQARFANAVFTYEPNFADSRFDEGTASEAIRKAAKASYVFTHASPYVIAATPPNDKPWGIYEPGCKNGLIVQGRKASVAISTDAGTTWSPRTELADRLDLTDLVKGHRSYLLALEPNSGVNIADCGLRWTTVCQCNAAILPRLKDEGTEITYAASNRALVSAGPNLAHAQAAVLEGELGQGNSATLQLATPPGEPMTHLFAAAHVASSNPPDPGVKYQIEYSTNAGHDWLPLVRDWSIPRRGVEPNDFWSQSFVWGDSAVVGDPQQVQVRFKNNGGKRIRRAEVHAAYRLSKPDSLRVTYAWSDTAANDHSATHRFEPREEEQTWQIPTAKGVVTRWVEMEPIP